MTKVDLITGFLGSGKTTFIRNYAQYLIGKGCHIGIIENDFGAVNVDMMLLKDLEGDMCELEMVSGGCDLDCHIRRFKTKLIALGMLGLDRVIIEPSGIYDVDEFFDVLCEEPLDRFYEIGSVITVVDKNIDEDISEDASYLLSSQLSSTGCVLLSHVEDEKGTDDKIVSFLNNVLASSKCERIITEDEIVSKSFEILSESDFARIADAGYRIHTFEKKNVSEEGNFKSLYFMNLNLDKERLIEIVNNLFKDHCLGKVMRVKGFLELEGGKWMEINATRDEIKLREIADGQNVIIVIGECLEEVKISGFFDDI